MKYNCYRTLDFSHEKNRMCDSFKNCGGCPLECNYSCKLTEEISQKEIYIVQKWSDEHQEETMLEHFKKLFPNALYYSDKIPKTCPKELGWIDQKTCNKLRCNECWNEPYKEDKQ